MNDSCVTVPGSGRLVMDRTEDIGTLSLQTGSTAVLAHTAGRKAEAAALLGISRKTLLEKRKRYGIA